MFYKKGCGVLDEKGESIHSCAVVSWCCSVIFLPADERKVLDFIQYVYPPLPQASLIRRSRLEVVFSVGMRISSLRAL